MLKKGILSCLSIALLCHTTTVSGAIIIPSGENGSPAPKQSALTDAITFTLSDQKTAIISQSYSEQAAENTPPIAETEANAQTTVPIEAQNPEQISTSNVADLPKPEPVKGPCYYETQAGYYSWKNNLGQSGYQFIQPYNLYYASGQWEYSLSTAYVVSQTNSLNSKGKITTLTDTALSIANTTKLGTYQNRYSLDFNFPTGKTSLSDTQLKAVVDEDLVPYSSFGEGMNISPGFSISRNISQEDSLNFAILYNFRGSYNSGGIIAKPGVISSKSLTWQHSGQTWQLTTTLSHQSYRKGRSGDTEYREGDELGAGIVYSKSLSPNKNLMLYYRLLNTQPYQDLTTPANSGSHNLKHYSGFMVSRSYGENRLRLSGDYLLNSGSNYDPQTNLAIAGKTKYNIGFGYDHILASGDTIALDIQKYFMQSHADNKVTAANYSGTNIIIKYNSHF